MPLHLQRGLVLALVLLAACNSQPQARPNQPFQVTPIPAATGTSQLVSTPAAGQPYPLVATSTSAYPGPPTATPTGDRLGRDLTALKSLPFAQAQAVSDFSPNARLYAIVPSTVMIANLGNPPVVLGWFYKFKAEGSPREFVVQVVDGKVSGAVETEPITQVPPLQRVLPVDKVTLDSNQVYERLVQQAPTLGITVTNPKLFDLELVNLETMTNPVWSVYEPTTSRWVLSLDAVSGEAVPNPHK